MATACQNGWRRGFTYGPTLPRRQEVDDRFQLRRGEARAEVRRHDARELLVARRDRGGRVEDRRADLLGGEPRADPVERRTHLLALGAQLVARHTLKLPD